MSEVGDEDFYVAHTQKTGLNDLNIVPILDMFICIIFFLLLSTSMMSYTKHVLPPSATKASTESVSDSIPNNPKIYAITKGGAYKIILKWEGANPSSKEIEFTNEFYTKPELLIKQVKDLVAEYKKLFPNEKTIQVTMRSEFPYQILISIMDGVRELMPDVVLNSYESADGLQE